MWAQSLLKEIGDPEIRKFFGVFMTMLGTFLGGVAVVRYGMMPALLVGAFAGPCLELANARPRDRNLSLEALNLGQ